MGVGLRAALCAPDRTPARPAAGVAQQGPTPPTGIRVAASVSSLPTGSAHDEEPVGREDCAGTAARALRHPDVRPAGRGTQRRLLARRMACAAGERAAHLLLRNPRRGASPAPTAATAPTPRPSASSTVPWTAKATSTSPSPFANPDGRGQNPSTSSMRCSSDGRLVVTGGAASTRAARKALTLIKDPRKTKILVAAAPTTSRRVLLPNYPQPVPRPAAAAVGRRRPHPTGSPGPFKTLKPSGPRWHVNSHLIRSLRA